jgi:hypothetical protein
VLIGLLTGLATRWWIGALVWGAWSTLLWAGWVRTRRVESSGSSRAFRRRVELSYKGLTAALSLGCMAIALFRWGEVEMLACLGGLWLYALVMTKLFPYRPAKYGVSDFATRGITPDA